MEKYWKYLPILKWKKGEQFALKRLYEPQWDGLVPLLELEPMGSAPDAPSIRDVAPAYIKSLAKQIESSIPEDRMIAIDTRYACSSYAKQANLLFFIFNMINKEVPHYIIPTISASWVPLLATLPSPQLKTLSELDDVILRFRTDAIQADQVIPTIDELAKYVKRKRIHVVLDQFSLVEKKPADCVDNITPYIQEALKTVTAGVTVAGGSFPENLTGKKRGTTDIDRVEWKVWEQLQKDGFKAKIAYSDYTVTNPVRPPDDMDGAKVNPSISIRYAGPDFWRLFKGVQFKNVPNRGELKILCQLLTSEPVYSGSIFSHGDAQYAAYAIGPDTNGSPWTWRRDATNHHIALTASAL